MKEPVVIKSYQLNGLKLVMEPSVSFEEILASLAERLKKSRKFFKDIPKGLLFEGRKLSLDEQKQILSCVRENSDMNIVCVIEEDKDLQEQINEEVKKACLELEKLKETGREEPEEDAGLFFKGSLRSGQVLESEKSIIVLGDVKPGANVISKGNVIVLGSLWGNVFAGADGNKKAFVVALDMQPVQIRIDDFIARSPDRPEKEKVKQAKIAFLEKDNIYIEPVCREVYNDIQI